MSIRLVATLALCANVGSVELDPCTGFRSTYEDPVTNVRHDCQFICEIIIRAYREYCMEYCPEYYRCNEHRVRTTTRVQTTALSTYPATDKTIAARYPVTVTVTTISMCVAIVSSFGLLAYLCRKSIYKPHQLSVDIPMSGQSSIQASVGGHQKLNNRADPDGCRDEQYPESRDCEETHFVRIPCPVQIKRYDPTGPKGSIDEEPTILLNQMSR